MKRFLCGAALLCVFCSAAAQSPIEHDSSMAIGDVVPDVTIKGVINHPSTEIRLSDYRGQLLILDFWATWCSPCIASFPKTDSLNREYAGKAVILPVTYQSHPEVAKLFSNKASLRQRVLPMVTADQLLHELFPHQQLPHYVWIDAQGKVIAITGSREVSREGIATVLKEGTVQMEEKKDLQLPYNREVPLLFNNAGFTPQEVSYQVLLTGYHEQLASRLDVLRYDDNSIARVSFVNMNPRRFFMMAYSTDEQVIMRNRLLLEVKDITKFKSPAVATAGRAAYREWMKQNTYCFEFMVPRYLSAHTLQLMQQDLQRLFPHYKASLQKRMVNCLVLERTSTHDKIKTSGQPVAFHFDQVEITLTNCSLELLLAQLNGVTLQHLDTPLVNGTGYSSKVDLALTGDLSNLDNIRQALKKYDLDIVPRKKTIEMLVITDSE